MRLDCDISSAHEAVGNILRPGSFNLDIYCLLMISFSSFRVIDGWLRMGLLPPREFCRHILSCRKLKAESFKRCLHSVLWCVSL